MVSIVAQLPMRMHGYRYVVHQSFLLCTIQMHFGMQETPVIGCFLGANVAVHYLSLRVQLGAESWVITPNGAHRARTAHPFPQTGEPGVHMQDDCTNTVVSKE